MVSSGSIDEVVSLVTSCILSAANNAIPQPSTRLLCFPKPWWNEECQMARKDQNKAWNRFQRYPTPDNMIAFNKARARARKIHLQHALPISASIYTAELHALRIAIEHISLSRGKKFIIYTDSLSALQSIVSLHSSSHPILVDITYALANHLEKKDIRFCWISGHAGITGNEVADTAARSATCSSERFPIPHSDLKADFRQKLQSVWQSN
ncbi:RNase H domain-containing protein [Trichonephila clavata]|uniref:RNase H domain-containing protein n=1 Tax=Trichonephila clavata TaxID=2740835 RepID=A0A8X6F163_TRICU|nr:RNase H domain-containing protein [Trichonephila clavata]